MHCRFWKPGIAVLGLLLALGSASAALQQYQTVEGVGAIIRQNQAAARTRALHEAMRKALEQVLTEVLPPEVLVEQRQILAAQLLKRATRYIRSYRILWEYPDEVQKVYRIGLEAEVAVPDVLKEIQALGLTQRRGRLLLAVSEHNPLRAAPSPYTRPRSVVAEVLRTRLLAAGFDLVASVSEATWVGQETLVLQRGRSAGATLALIGHAEARQTQENVAGMGVQVVQATVNMTVWDVRAGKQLTMERAEATVLHADAVLASKQALEKAAAELATRLLPILQAHARQATGS